MYNVGFFRTFFSDFQNKVLAKIIDTSRQNSTTE